MRVLFREDEIILPPWTIGRWFEMAFVALFASVMILPMMGSVPLLIYLLYSGERSPFTLLGAGTISALAICLVHDLCKGKCVLLNWPGGTMLFGMGEFLTSEAALLNILLLGRARHVLRRVKADGGWILRFGRRWPFGWTQLKFTVPLDRIGPVGLRVSVNPYTNQPEHPPAMRVDFGERTPHSLELFPADRQGAPYSLELFPADAIAVAERLRLWEQEALSRR